MNCLTLQQQRAGIRKFVDLCHGFGIRILPYCSSSYIHRHDAEYDLRFSHTAWSCTDMHYDYAIGWTDRVSGRCGRRFTVEPKRLLFRTRIETSAEE